MTSRRFSLGGWYIRQSDLEMLGLLSFFFEEQVPVVLLLLLTVTPSEVRIGTRPGCHSRPRTLGPMKGSRAPVTSLPRSNFDSDILGVTMTPAARDLPLFQIPDQANALLYAATPMNLKPVHTSQSTAKIPNNLKATPKQ